MAGALSDHIARTAIEMALCPFQTHTAASSALANMVETAKVVAIGESFHHTHEHLAMREQLVRFLVSHCGFNVLLLEAVAPGPNPLDAFVRLGADDAESALIAAGARMWRNHETASLLRWLRLYNEAHIGAEVSIQGLDVLAIGASMRRVLERSKHADTAQIMPLTRGFDVDGRSDQAAYNALTCAQRAALHQVFADARDALAPHDAAHESALIVNDALNMLRAGSDGWTNGFALRDRAMADAASRQIARSDATDKFIILSHNTHIAALAPSTPPVHPPMGAILRKHLGGAYFALGAAFNRARFDPSIYGVSDFAAIPDSTDQHIAALGYQAALVDLRRAALTDPIRLQGVGVGPAPYFDFPSVGAFDALFYVDTLTNARQIVDTDLSLDIQAADATRP